MPDSFAELLARALVWGGFNAAMVGVTLAMALTLWAIAGPWWPTTVVQNGYRRRRSCWALLQALAISTTPIIILGADSAGFGAVLFLLFGPKYVNWRVRRGAWRDDDDDTRQRAREIRNRLRDRQEEQLVAEDAGPWPEYVNDVVRAQRERRYEPPAIDPKEAATG